MKQEIRDKKIKSIALGLALAATLAIPAVSRAQVVMTAGDSLGNSSFNTAGNWSSAAAPAAGSTYSTLGYLLRSPATAGSYTFAGDSLTVGSGNGGGANPFSSVTANNNALIFKVSAITLTVDNLILDGAQIRDGNGDGQWAALDGNITVTANGGVFIAQDTNIINSAIHGTGTLYIGDNGNGDAARVVEFTSGSSDFTGNIVFNNSGGSATRSRAAWTAGSLLNFDIGANGVNNDISGQGTLELGGDFAFDLSAADNTIGDSWDIVDSTTTTTYDGTFDVNGFTQNGLLWDASANGANYQFDQGTGILSVIPVPEPSTLALCGIGIAGLLAWKRKNK